MKFVTRWTCLVAAILGAFMLVLMLVCSPDGPNFEAKPLTHWLSGWYCTQPPRSPAAIKEWVAKRHEGEKAVRQLGTNSIPTLRRLLRQRDSALKVRLTRIKWITQSSVLSGYLEPAWKWNRTGAQALSLLGSNAAPAVPDLIKTLETNSDEESRRCAAACLGSIGPAAAEAVPALTKISILEPYQYLRSTAREALISIGPARTNGLMVAWPYRNSTNAVVNLAFQMTIDIVDPDRIYGGRTLQAEPDGAANRSQPVRLESNSTSAAAGSGR